MYELVQNDTTKQFKATLTREDGTVIDCGGGSVRMYFRKKGTKTILSTLTAADAGTNLQNGIAIFTFEPTDLNIEPDYYEGQIEMTFSNGLVESVTELLQFQVKPDFNQ